METLRLGSAAMVIFLLVQPSAVLASPEIQRGLALVRTQCSVCHAIDKTSPSPLSLAPPLRDLHERYPVEHLEEAFAEGISAGHSVMPEFQFEPDQIGDLISFLKSLE